MKWKEETLINYLFTRSGYESTINDIFEYFSISMTSSNIANFRGCFKIYGCSRDKISKTKLIIADNLSCKYYDGKRKIF